MKKFVPFGLLGLLSLTVLDLSCGGGPGPLVLTVLSPNGGETWTGGCAVTVTWNPMGYLGNVDIEYSLNSGVTWLPLATAPAGPGTWTGPAPSASSVTARIQVSAQDGNPLVALAPSDTSNADFTLSPAFTDLGASGLPNLAEGGLAWGDYDNDGFLDVACSGFDGTSNVAKIFKGNGLGGFVDIGAGLFGARGGLAWGDFDDDGDLDLATSGADVASLPRATIYRNTGGVFADIGAGLTGIQDQTSVAWGDYDNDGDLDLVISGFTGTIAITKIYRNVAGVFTDIVAGIVGLRDPSVAWGDYDNDGDLDLAVAGLDPSTVPVAKVYKNVGGVFGDIFAPITGANFAALAWGDYDNDGNLDLAIAGYQLINTVPTTKLYQGNGAGAFAAVAAPLTGLTFASLAFGDFDNDGDLDLVVAGADDVFGRTKVYRNDGLSGFVDSGIAFTEAYDASVVWGDFDGDGDLDLLVSGQDASGLAITPPDVPRTKLYRNNACATNSLPSAPSTPIAVPATGQFTLSWGASTDSATPSPGLSYNLRVERLPGPIPPPAGEFFPTMANVVSGFRRVVALGPVRQNPLIGYTLRVPRGPYQVSIQAIDASLAGGPWSTPLPVNVP